MKKLNFLFLFVGGLMILGCPLGAGGGEDQKNEELTITALPSNGGSVTRSPDQTRYPSDSSVTLTANPASGYLFTRWEGDATGSGNPTMITMDGGKTVTAVFTRSYTLAVAASPSDGGTVVRRPFIFNASSDDETPGQTQYASELSVSITATPATGYEFTRWEGDATGTANPITMKMNGDKTVTAVFTPATTPLIRFSPSGHTFWATGPDGGPYSIDSSFMVDITNGGIGTLSGLDCSFPSGMPAWLSATLSGSTAPATLVVTVAPLQLGLGSWQLSVSTKIAITSAAAGNSPLYIGICVMWREHEPYYGPFILPGHSPAPPTKVICAELHRQGLMDETIFQADEAFGRYLNDNHKDVLLGYQLWARPVVKWMQKSSIVTRIVASVATPWSYEMAYRMGARDKGSFAGRILMDVGVPACRTIGRVVIGAGNRGLREDADSVRLTSPLEKKPQTDRCLTGAR